ncbi:molecular chaperone [Achromobacter deleyi]|uniref:fimbrial biogenesis chaperone n=1 Tax=Achromobacter deleyi TaxID=1353891 RepID=UPI001492328F|nr:molecular chaperone [Achromobacter deleyi]QVQ26815.1 molecular chaperone [Achromobacter deleyi]UIP22390.1 molecular chaperone [Achromobacter deleyi]
MNTLFQRLLPVIAVVGVLAGSVAQAAIQLSTTRVIINEKDKNVSVFAKNHGTDPFVVQAWIDGDSEEMETPFFVTPPLSRFDGNAERSLNITRVGEGLAGDRESYYWLNVLEIPQKKAGNAENSLTLATRTRIKLFYRPTAIQKMPRGHELVQWSWTRDGKQCRLAIKNTSAFTVNFAAIDVAGEAAGFGRTVVAKPFATTEMPLGKCPGGAIKAKANVVNDYGVVEAWPEVSVPSEAGGPERR